MWDKLSKYLYSENGSPVGIQVKFKQPKLGFSYMVSQKDEYDKIKSVSLAAFFEDMLIELKHQVMEYAKSIHLEEGQTTPQLQNVILNNFKTPEVLNLYQKGVNFEYDGLKVFIPKQVAGEKAEAYKIFKDKMISFGYINLR